MLCFDNRLWKYFFFKYDKKCFDIVSIYRDSLCRQMDSMMKSEEKKKKRTEGVFVSSLGDWLDLFSISIFLSSLFLSLPFRSMFRIFDQTGQTPRPNRTEKKKNCRHRHEPIRHSSPRWGNQERIKPSTNFSFL